jgi:hypothetical protein
MTDEKYVDVDIEIVKTPARAVLAEPGPGFEARLQAIEEALRRIEAKINALDAPLKYTIVYPIHDRDNTWKINVECTCGKSTVDCLLHPIVVL